MFNIQCIIFILFRIIILMSNANSDFNEVLGIDNSPFGLRKINSHRKRFGPVKMLQVKHQNNVTKPYNMTENDSNHMEKILDQTAEDNSDVSGIVHKDSTPTTSVIEDQNKRMEKGLPPKITSKEFENKHSKKNCWTQVNAKRHFKIMDILDKRYESFRKKFRDLAEKDNFSKDMLDMMLRTRGAAQREIHNAAGDPSFIPAGINLGGYNMMQLEDSILFFHRMKLRNNTHFRVKMLQNDLANMVLTVQLSLNDLHILGAYERATTPNDPTELFYTPTYGEVEFLLKNVEYNMEGRYRMLQNKLAIELVVSDIAAHDILMTYQNEKKAKRSVALEPQNIDLDKWLKTDLDKWLKDYFNDYLMYFGMVGEKANAKILRYNQEKTIALNEYADEVLEKIVQRMKELKLRAVKLPDFSITSVNGMQLKLTQGVLRGLETIYRRSLATGKREKRLRKVNTMVGFSSLKATYQYEAVSNTGVPPINGMLMVTADELIAHMGLTWTKKPETLNLVFDSIQQIKPESLTLEGPANRIMGNFKNLLERHVFTFISSTIIYNINMLSTITKCEPSLNAYTKNKVQEYDRNLDINSTDTVIDQYPNSKENSNENHTAEKNSSMNNDTQKSEENFTENKQNSKVNSTSDKDDELNAENKSTITNENIDTEDKALANNEENNKSPSNNSNNENDNEHTATNTDLDNYNDKENKNDE